MRIGIKELELEVKSITNVQKKSQKFKQKAEEGAANHLKGSLLCCKFP